MNTLRGSHIVHIFAALHAVIVLLCQWLNLSDEFLLTVATVSMIAIIGIRKGQGFGIIAASVIAGNIIGVVIGTYGAELLADFLPINVLHPITSMITTEIIGLGALLLYNSLGGGEFAESLDARYALDCAHYRGIAYHTSYLLTNLW